MAGWDDFMNMLFPAKKPLEGAAQQGNNPVIPPAAPSAGLDMAKIAQQQADIQKKQQPSPLNPGAVIAAPRAKPDVTIVIPKGKK